jgi:hypothetical protein
LRAAQGFPAPEGDGKAGAWLAFARDGMTAPNLLPTIKRKKGSGKKGNRERKIVCRMAGGGVLRSNV